MLRDEARRKAFEARWSEVKAKNLKALDEGTFEGPIVPIGMRPPEPPKQKATTGEDKAEEVSFFRLLYEPPEAPEGGSSGSGEAPLPPLPPPLQPPPPEAPATEVAPSKAEEVKKLLVEASARMEKEAYRALEDEFIAVAKPEDLRKEDREMYENVRDEGLSVRGRCRWRFGCEECDEVKAWSFACRTTLWNTAHEAVRPKAKPKGRPKKAADA